MLSKIWGACTRRDKCLIQRGSIFLALAIILTLFIQISPAHALSAACQDINTVFGDGILSAPASPPASNYDGQQPLSLASFRPSLGEKMEFHVIPKKGNFANSYIAVENLSS